MHGSPAKTSISEGEIPDIFLPETEASNSYHATIFSISFFLLFLYGITPSFLTKCRL
jgi:hypothetical protein